MAKRKSFIMSLFDMYLSHAEEKTPEEELRAHLDAVKAALSTELSGFVAAALFAKKTLDTSRQVDMPFPDAVLSGEASVDAAAQATLGAYVKELEKFQAALLERESPVSLTVGKGLTTWIVTFYAMLNPALLPLAHELWNRLNEGYDGVEDAYKFMLRRDPSVVERTYFSYRPAALITTLGVFGFVAAIPALGQ